MSAPHRSQRGDPPDPLPSSSVLRPLPSTPSRATTYDGDPNPTYAAFSPTAALSATPAAAASSMSAAKRRSTILVHQKSPLLLATPPQITRALAYSHPFLLPLNKLAGLLSWTTGDPWESFLLVVAWWGGVLYGDVVIRTAGPVVVVLALIAGMYGRRYSPLSSSGFIEDSKPSRNTKGSSSVRGKSKSQGQGQSQGQDGAGTAGTATAKAIDIAGASGRGGATTAAAAAAAAAATAPAGTPHQRSASEITHARHQKTLDEIVDTLKEFTGRCNVLLEPLLELTDFLSTQRTATSATTRPALTTLLVRILLCAPFWFALTLPPLRIVTTRRVMLVIGTVGLTWHAQVMKVVRAILWRSATVRQLTALVTGLQFEGPMEPNATAGGLFPSASNLSGTTAISTSTARTTTTTTTSAPRESELTRAIRRARGGNDAGVRFTFIIYENQRRWVGLGWTTSLFAYERTAWTDEHNNAVPPRDQFELPEVEDGSNMRWRWVEGSRWKVDGVPDEAVRVDKAADDQAGGEEEEWQYDGEGGRMGWVYYDNKVSSTFPHCCASSLYLSGYVAMLI